MGPAIAIFIVIGQLAMLAFWHYAPEVQGQQEKQLKTYNMMVSGVCAFLCLVFFINVRMWLVDVGTKTETTNFISIGGAMAIETVFMLIFLLVRNFWVFKGKNYNPNKWF